jgi:hypothetical protein
MIFCRLGGCGKKRKKGIITIRGVYVRTGSSVLEGHPKKQVPNEETGV